MVQLIQAAAVAVVVVVVVVVVVAINSNSSSSSKSKEDDFSIYRRSENLLQHKGLVILRNIAPRIASHEDLLSWCHMHQHYISVNWVIWFSIRKWKDLKSYFKETLESWLECQSSNKTNQTISRS